MRYTLLMPLFALMLAACSKSDKQKIAGTWGFYELKRGPEKHVIFSLDEKKQKEVIENEIRLQKEMVPMRPEDEALIRKNATQQYENMTKLTFTFGEDGNLKIESNLPDKSANQETKYLVDDVKKELTVKSDNREIKWNYSFLDDKMILSGDQEELIMINKK